MQAMSKAFRHVQTIDDALVCQSDSIITLCLVNGTDAVEANIAMQLVELQKTLGVRNKLNEEQCDELAAEITATFKHLTMADIHVIFRRAKHGEYGDMYERISIPKVLTWFRKYTEEREDTAVKRSEREAEQYKSYVGNDERRHTGEFLSETLKKMNLRK